MPEEEMLSWKLNKRNRGRHELYPNEQLRNSSTPIQGMEDNEIMSVTSVESLRKELGVLCYASL